MVSHAIQAADSELTGINHFYAQAKTAQGNLKEIDENYDEYAQNVKDYFNAEFLNIGQAQQQVEQETAQQQALNAANNANASTSADLIPAASTVK